MIRFIRESSLTVKERIKKGLEEMGFSLENFDKDYELAKDNYKQEYNVENPEAQDDFEFYCREYWS